MQAMELNKAFTLMESGPVVLVTTHDGQKNNIMTIFWSMVMDFTPVFAITTDEWFIPSHRQSRITEPSPIRQSPHRHSRHGRNQPIHA